MVINLFVMFIFCLKSCVQKPLFIFFIYFYFGQEDIFHLRPDVSRKLDGNVITKPALRGNILMPFHLVNSYSSVFTL